jgi:chaperonin GroEL
MIVRAVIPHTETAIVDKPAEAADDHGHGHHHHH